MPVLVIYHSRGAYPARLAAALHLGLIPPEPPAGEGGLDAALDAVGGLAALRADELWAAGTDERGRRVFAAGRSSRPDVAHRAFHDIADLAGIPHAAFALRNVGPSVAWDDLAVKALRFTGLAYMARRALLGGLRRNWTAARRAGEAGRAVTGAGGAAPGAPDQADGVCCVIYFCYGGAHSSVTTANIHLGHLPLDRRPGVYDVLHQPLFDRAESYDLGQLRQMGTDEWGNRICVLGLSGGWQVMGRVLVGFLAACGVPLRRYRFEGTLRSAGLLLRIGGFTSRGLGWVAFGRPLSALGVWLKYPRFAAHARRVRRDLTLTQNPPSDIIG